MHDESIATDYVAGTYVIKNPLNLNKYTLILIKYIYGMLITINTKAQKPNLKMYH